MTPKERREAEGLRYRLEIERAIRHMQPVRRGVFLEGVRFALAMMKEDSPGHRAGASCGKGGHEPNNYSVGK